MITFLKQDNIDAVQDVYIFFYDSRAKIGQPIGTVSCYMALEIGGVIQMSTEDRLEYS